MVHLQRRSGTWLLFATFAVWPAQAAGSNPVPEGKEDQQGTAHQIRKILDIPVTFEFERGPLREAVAYLQDRYNLPLVVDQKAFVKDLGMADVGDVEVAMPKLNGAKLRTVLRLLLDQVDGAIQLQDGLVMIVPQERLKPEYLLRRPVTARFLKQPLTEVLAELAQSTEFSIVVDVRATDQAKASVSAAFHQVPLEEAVFVLADMAGLKPVKVGHVLYVTTKENANDIQAKRDLLPAKMPPAAD